MFPARTESSICLAVKAAAKTICCVSGNDGIENLQFAQRLDIDAAAAQITFCQGFVAGNLTRTDETSTVTAIRLRERIPLAMDTTDGTNGTEAKLTDMTCGKMMKLSRTAHRIFLPQITFCQGFVAGNLTRTDETSTVDIDTAAFAPMCSIVPGVVIGSEMLGGGKAGWTGHLFHYNEDGSLKYDENEVECSHCHQHHSCRYLLHCRLCPSGQI